MTERAELDIEWIRIACEEGLKRTFETDKGISDMEVHRDNNGELEITLDGRVYRVEIW